MLKIIAVIVVVLIVGVLAYAATRPNDFRVARSTTVKATPDTIQPVIADFHRWSAWSPYEKLDPSMKRTYDGSPSGKGAVYAWEGNAKAGAGRMEIVDSTPSRVAIQLDFTAPFTAHNLAEFTLAPSGDSTTVTWAMTGARPFVAKLMSLFFDFDQLIGKDFETGLANLKAVAEGKAGGA